MKGRSCTMLIESIPFVHPCAHFFGDPGDGVMCHKPIECLGTRCPVSSRPKESPQRSTRILTADRDVNPLAVYWSYCVAEGAEGSNRWRMFG